MSDEHTVMDDAVAELFATLERDAKALAPRFHRAQQVVRDAEAEAAATTARLAVAEAAHRTELDRLEAAHKAKLAERERELRVKETALAEREKAAEELHRRAEAQMRMAEMRAADLSNRLHGHAA